MHFRFKLETLPETHLKQTSTPSIHCQAEGSVLKGWKEMAMWRLQGVNSFIVPSLVLSDLVSMSRKLLLESVNEARVGCRKRPPHLSMWRGTAYVFTNASMWYQSTFKIWNQQANQLSSFLSLIFVCDARDAGQSVSTPERRSWHVTLGGRGSSNIKQTGDPHTRSIMAVIWRARRWEQIREMHEDKLLSCLSN